MRMRWKPNDVVGTMRASIQHPPDTAEGVHQGTPTEEIEDVVNPEHVEYPPSHSPRKCKTLTFEADNVALLRVHLLRLEDQARVCCRVGADKNRDVGSTDNGGGELCENTRVSRVAEQVMFESSVRQRRLKATIRTAATRKMDANIVQEDGAATTSREEGEGHATADSRRSDGS